MAKLSVQQKKLAPPLLCAWVATVLLVALNLDPTVRNPIDPRSLDLANRLSSCASYDVVAGDIRVGYSLDGNVVIDARLCKGDARLVDVLHLLLQFAVKLKGSNFEYLSIAGGGKEVYRLPREDLKELAEQYGEGAKLWAINHWAERLRKPDGERPFSTWDGGALGVLTAQLADMNKALRTWLDEANVTTKDE
ncbi:hypothetical protein [Singulisphaera sp. PoT]|uniref:hypothetical protein n=1 Tax=Singulisphaera sp. PoT TaxID=3411797 RepID=UPI003BF5DBEE